MKLHAELLLGKEVVDVNGKHVGHIEELIATKRGGDTVITEFHAGRAAMAERMSAHGVAMIFLGVFGARRRGSAKPYRIKWRDLDLSDPLHPRTTKPLEELEQ